MIDIQLVRNDPEYVKKALARKKVDPSDIDRLLDADRRFREVSGQRDELRSRKNDLSRQFGQAKKSGDEAAAERVRADSQRRDDDERKLDGEADAADAERRDLLLRIPNIPADEAADGDSEAENVVIRIENYDPESYGPHQRVPEHHPAAYTPPHREGAPACVHAPPSPPWRPPSASACSPPAATRPSRRRPHRPRR